MIKGKVTVEDKDLGMDRLMREIRRDAVSVDIGIHSDEDATLLVIAAANEFGATIRHPGGTAYGYATAADAKRRRVKFLKGGVGFKVLGVTGPHIIEIPARSYIRSTMDEQGAKFAKASEGLLGRMIDGEISKFEALELMGQLIESEIKTKIVTLREPQNAPSTIRRKGSDNPLLDKGHLIESVRYVVKTASERAIGGD